jgi:uncharacterized protein YaiL (DUF2058 family)
MSDSIRDQLLKAGFSKPKADPPKPEQRKSPHPKRHQSPNKTGTHPNAQRRQSADPKQARQAALDAAAAQRKELKAQIKTLIEATAIKELKGEIVYRFTLQNRIRELHISENVHKQLVADELVITRLNGSTYLVPAKSAKEIKLINPDWAIVVPKDASKDTSEGYDAFPVPDNLQW